MDRWMDRYMDGWIIVDGWMDKWMMSDE